MFMVRMLLFDEQLEGVDMPLIVRLQPTLPIFISPIKPILTAEALLNVCEILNPNLYTVFPLAISVFDNTNDVVDKSNPTAVTLILAVNRRYSLPPRIKWKVMGVGVIV